MFRVTGLKYEFASEDAKQPSSIVLTARMTEVDCKAEVLCSTAAYILNDRARLTIWSGRFCSQVTREVAMPLARWYLSLSTTKLKQQRRRYSHPFCSTVALFLAPVFLPTKLHSSQHTRSHRRISKLAMPSARTYRVVQIEEGGETIEFWARCGAAASQRRKRPRYGEVFTRGLKRGARNNYVVPARLLEAVSAFEPRLLEVQCVDERVGDEAEEAAALEAERATEREWRKRQRAAARAKGGNQSKRSSLVVSSPPSSSRPSSRRGSARADSRAASNTEDTEGELGLVEDAGDGDEALPSEPSTSSSEDGGERRTHQTLRMRVHLSPVPHFAGPADLCRYKCFLLDTWDAVYVWVGTRANERLRLSALKMATSFAKSINDNAGRWRKSVRVSAATAFQA
jgi:hypothetical protein